jgi:hypothetical protein
MNTNAAALTVTLVIATLGSAGCGVPPEGARLLDPDVQHPGFTAVPGPATARPIPAAPPETAPPADQATIPEALRAGSLTDVAGACASEDGRPVATVTYRAVRGDRADQVVLTFRSDNGYVHFDHRRGDQELGALRVDVVMGSETVFPALVAGQELSTAYLMAELPSPALAAVLPATQECLYQGIDGQVTRDGETFFYVPACDFAGAALAAVAAAGAESAARACCASAPSKLSCTDCRRGAQAAALAFDRPGDPRERQACADQGAGDSAY